MSKTKKTTKKAPAKKKKVAAKKEKKVSKPLKKTASGPDKKAVKKIAARVEKVTKKEVAPEKKKKIVYYYAVGRRKTAVAKVFLFKNGNGQVEINGRGIKEFFPWEPYRSEVYLPLSSVGQKDRLDVKCVVKGGGMRAQAEAVRLGIARALLRLNPVFRRALKKHSYLTRDPRIKERKKYGLKRARRAPQWKKR